MHINGSSLVMYPHSVLYATSRHTRRPTKCTKRQKASNSKPRYRVVDCCRGVVFRYPPFAHCHIHHTYRTDKVLQTIVNHLPSIVVVVVWSSVVLCCGSKLVFDIFPISAPKLEPCPYVYTFVLSSQHIMIINDVECVTLGHDFDDDVVRHGYFGTQAIIEDLKKLEGIVERSLMLYPCPCY